MSLDPCPIDSKHSNSIDSYSVLPSLCKVVEDTLKDKTDDYLNLELVSGKRKINLRRKWRAKKVKSQMSSKFKEKKRRRKTHLWLHRPKQRNTRLEEMSMNGFSTEEDSRGGHDQICCLYDSGERCTNQAGNASYSKRIQKTVQQRKLKLVRDDSVSHIYICDYHKNVIQSVRTKRKRKDSEDGNGSPDVDEDLPEIDFFQMPVNTLRRYKRHYKLMTRPGMNNKAQLADTVARHFKTIPVNEKEALTYFIYMAKNFKSRFDQKHLDNVNST